MSFDHTRMVWALARRGALPFGRSPSRLAVMLDLADRADRFTGEVVASTHALAHDTAAARRTVQGVLDDLVAGAWLDVTLPPAGTRQARYRWTEKLSTAVTGSTTEDSPSHHTVATSRHLVVPEDTASGDVRPPNSSTSFIPVPPGEAAPVHNSGSPGEIALALVVAVESNLVTIRGPVGSPEALAAKIAERITAAYGKLLENPLPGPRETARAILAADMSPACPLFGCGAIDAHAHLDEGKCSTRGRQCPYLVPELGAPALNGSRPARHVEL